MILDMKEDSGALWNVHTEDRTVLGKGVHNFVSTKTAI